MGACGSTPPMQTIVIQGYVGSGKSTLLQLLLTSSITTIIQSGVSIFTGYSQKNDNTPVKHIHSWHYKKGQSQPTSILTKCSGLIFLIDSTATHQLTCDDTEPQSIRTAIHTLAMMSELQGKPILILANKQDAYEAESVSVIHDLLGLNDLDMAPRLWHIHECSTRTQASVMEGIQWLDRAIAEMSLLTPSDRSSEHFPKHIATISDRIWKATSNTPVEKAIRADSIIHTNTNKFATNRENHTISCDHITIHTPTIETSPIKSLSP